MSDLSKSLEQLEVSVLSHNTFQQLNLETVGDLVEVSQKEFLEAAAEIAPDEWRVSPALKEVNEILADMGLSLAKSEK